MPALRNPRHERFARKYFELGIARHAYIEAGYRAHNNNPSRSTSADVCAYRLRRNAKVIRRLQELGDMAAKRHEVTQDSLIEELEEARQIAAGNAQSGAMVAASMGKARITGFIVDRKEVGKPGDFENMTEDELRAFVKQRTKDIADSEPAIAPANAQDDSESVSSALVTRLPPPTHGGSGTTQ